MGPLRLRRARNSDSERDATRQPVDFFAFDLASVETYFVADRVLTAAPSGFRWMPALSWNGRAPALDGDAEAAARRAAELGLPLQWPANHGARLRRAMRAADYAATHGFGGEFMHICSRLRFAGGFDIDGEMLSSLRVGALPRELAHGLVGAADDETRDLLLAASASRLAAQGVRRLPVLRLASRVACGHSAIIQMLEGGKHEPSQVWNTCTPRWSIGSSRPLPSARWTHIATRVTGRVPRTQASSVRRRYRP